MNITEPYFDDEEILLLKQVLDSRWVTQGPKTAEFEQLFAERHRAKFSLATTSCTAALHLSMLALNLGPGDEVIVPAFTWVTSAHAIEYVGATPIFVDVDLTSFNIDVAAIEGAITSRTRAIISVHLFGKAADMASIMAIAKHHNLAVVEDAACAVGCTFDRRPVGTLGDLGCFSFHPRKVITTGEGGMVTTDHPEMAKRIQYLRNHGATGPVPGSDPARAYAMATFNSLGFNLRLSDIQAAVGVAQMKKLDFLLKERRRLALCYSAMLDGIDEVIAPADDPGHTYQSYVIRLGSTHGHLRNRIMDNFSAAQIHTRPGTHAVHRLGFYAKKYDISADQFPNAATAEDTSITLPLFPGMTDSQQALVVRTLIKSLSESN